jgi:GT2 family glycosyltransferase
VREVQYVVPTLGTRPEYLELCLASIAVQEGLAAITLVCPSVARSRLEGVAHSHGAEIVVEDRPGIGAAINAGWKVEDTEYCGWLGDDDLLMPGSTAAVVQRLSRRDCLAVYGDMNVIDESGQLQWVVHPRKAASWLAGIGPNYLTQPGSVFRRTGVESVGGVDESLAYAMDLDLFLKLRAQGGIAYLPKTISAFRRHASSLTVSNPNPGAEGRTVRRSHQPAVVRLIAQASGPALDMVGKIWGRAQIKGWI